MSYLCFLFWRGGKTVIIKVLHRKYSTHAHRHLCQCVCACLCGWGGKEGGWKRKMVFKGKVGKTNSYHYSRSSPSLPPSLPFFLPPSPSSLPSLPSTQLPAVFRSGHRVRRSLPYRTSCIRSVSSTSCGLTHREISLVSGWCSPCH